METTSFDEAYLTHVLFGSPICVNSEEVAELVQKHIDGLAEDIEANKVMAQKVENLEKQLKEANEVIKYYANSFCGDKQEDGTYLIYTRENACGRVEVTYNPNIANNYLEKWGVK